MITVSKEPMECLLDVLLTQVRTLSKLKWFCKNSTVTDTVPKSERSLGNRSMAGERLTWQFVHSAYHLKSKWITTLNSVVISGHFQISKSLHPIYNNSSSACHENLCLTTTRSEKPDSKMFSERNATA